eukprot:5130709-Prymnesium_polylepis.1
MNLGETAASLSCVVLASGRHRYSVEVVGRCTTAIPLIGRMLSDEAAGPEAAEPGAGALPNSCSRRAPAAALTQAACANA